MKPILVRETNTLNASIGLDGAEYNYFYNPWHYHPEIELTLIVKSFGQRQVGDSIENFSAGDLVLLGSNVPHVWKNDELFLKNNTNMKAQAIVVKFMPDFAGEGFFDRPEMRATKKLLYELAPFGVKLHGSVRGTVAGIMLKLPGMNDTDRFLQLLQILNVISVSKEYKLLASISYKSCSTKNTHRVNKVLDYIMDHYQENLTLDDIAELVNMNKNAFCRFFKQGTRKNLFTVINEVRIGKACQHLTETNMDVREICYACGFNNISTFNKAFKQLMKVSPLMYRRNSREAARLEV